MKCVSEGTPPTLIDGICLDFDPTLQLFLGSVRFQRHRRQMLAEILMATNATPFQIKI